MSDRKSGKLKRAIIDLVTKVDKVESSDEILIDEVIYNFKLMIEAKKDIEKLGQVIIVENDYKGNIIKKYQRNPALDNYDKRLMNIKQLLQELSITPKERKFIVNALEKSVDEFKEEFHV